VRIAFVSGNREQLPDAVIPLGLLYVMSAVRDRHEAELVDLCFEDDPARSLACRLEEIAPDVVALGMRNIQSGDYSGVGHSLEYYRELVAAIRAVTRAPIVLGGSGFSVMPQQLVRHLEPDYGISGEGERALPALLDAIEGGRGFDAIGSLHRLRGGEVVSNPPDRDFLDMDSLRPPDRSQVDSRYYERFGIESVQTKRGCPLRCDYCTYPVIEGRVGRARDPRRVADEVEWITRHRPGAVHFFFVDSVFNLPRSHAKAVCRELIERELRLPWTCYANPLGFDAELAELMARAGCAGMEVGADSGSDEVLLRLRKGFDTARIRAFHELAVAAGVPDCHTFILGTPGESLDDVMRTLDFIVDLDPASVIIMVWTDDAEALDPRLASQRRALREEIFRVLEERKHEFPWWSIPAIGVNYDPKLFELLRRRGHHGPLWQHIRRLLAPAAGAGAQSPRTKKGATVTMESGKSAASRAALKGSSG
jgi:radical SAM superfamily enzyme YgiQ (UPF0313 family)